MKEQQTETTTTRLGKTYSVSIKHLPTGIVVEGEGRIFYRLKLDLQKELRRLLADDGYDMRKELSSPTEVKPQL